VILVDVNLLIYSKISDFPQHPKARDWLDRQLNSPGRVGLCWHSLLGFVRIVTNPRMSSQPLGIEQTWQQVEDWLSRPSAWIPTPGPRHQEVLATLIQATRPTGNLIPDTHLAALAIEHGLIMSSTDGDFARFPGLRWENPLS
jgi:uncharacterized protein